MPRPKRCRCVNAKPNVSYFKPRGVPLRQLEEVNLTIDEYEALRLYDIEGMEQEQAAPKMNVSRQTFGRILASARHKLADAVIGGKALRIEGGVFTMAERIFKCYDCDHKWELPYGTGRPNECPACKSTNLQRAEEDRGCAHRHPGGGRRLGHCGNSK